MEKRVVKGQSKLDIIEQKIRTIETIMMLKKDTIDLNPRPQDLIATRTNFIVAPLKPVKDDIELRNFAISVRKTIEETGLLPNSEQLSYSTETQVSIPILFYYEEIDSKHPDQAAKEAMRRNESNTAKGEKYRVIAIKVYPDVNIARAVADQELEEDEMIKLDEANKHKSTFCFRV